jgi:hypothetical protein
LRWLYRPGGRAGRNIDAYHHKYVDASHADPQPDPVDPDRNGYEYADCHLYADHYANKHSDIHFFPYSDAFVYTDALVDSLADAVPDAKPYSYAHKYPIEYSHADRYRDRHDHPIPVDDGHPSLSEVPALCCRSLGR